MDRFEFEGLISAYIENDLPLNKRKEIEDSLRKARDPFARGESFSVHEVIDPRETRKYLSLWAERIQTQLLTRNYLK